MVEPAWLRWLRRGGLAALATLVGVPVLVLLSTSLKPLDDVTGTFRWVPRDPTLRPYADMWSTVPLGRYVLNTVLVSTLTTVLAVLVATPAAFALARGPLRGRRPFLAFLLAVQAVPGLMLLVPLFVVYAEVGDAVHVRLVGSYTGLVLTDLAVALPFALWLLTAHMRSLPTELEDAARIDGAGTPAVLRHVTLPAAAPAIAAAAVLTFVVTWGEVLFASVLAQGPVRTLPVGLHAYADQTAVQWNQLAAAGLATSLPLLAALVLTRRLLAATLPG